MKKNIVLFIGLSFAAVIILFGCSDRNSITAVQPPPPDFATYQDNMKALFDGSCIGCHSGASAPNGYHLDTYAGVLGVGSDATPNAIAGDSTCLLITKIKNRTHFAWNTPDDQPKINLLIQWVVTDTLRQF